MFTYLNHDRALETIGRSVFASSDLLYVIVPSSVTFIDEVHLILQYFVIITWNVVLPCQNAFSSAAALESVLLPTSLTAIPAMCFLSCGKLTSIVIPTWEQHLFIVVDMMDDLVSAWSAYLWFRSVVLIGDAAFLYSGLLDVTVPSSVTFLGPVILTLGMISLK